ncbi:hypothetical protein [Paenibacillus sp. FSL L8-0463]|uniref:hypothetical protein n=1 Tax=Paenibacillus sp. FSL L8-0463 TaxID=2954687 RepID=UPI0031197BF7
MKSKLHIINDAAAATDDPSRAAAIFLQRHANIGKRNPNMHAFVRRNKVSD